MIKFILILFITVSLFAQDSEKYITAMKNNLEKMNTDFSSTSYQQLANSFERIAKAEGDKWLPYYYASYLLTLTTYIDTTNIDKDAVLDKAEELLSAADSLSPDNSEIYTVKAMIAQGRLIVDPQNRWMKYGPLFNNYINKAKELDPSNPRPDFLYAQSILHTPEQFGGGKGKALPHFKEAEKKYNNFEPESELHPVWGEELTKEILVNIEGNE
jgi:hypothetical protein